MRGPISPTSAPICFQIISFIFNIFSLSADTALLRVSFIKSIFLKFIFLKEKRRLLLVFVSCSFWSLKKNSRNFFKKILIELNSATRWDFAQLWNRSRDRIRLDSEGTWWDLMIYVGLGGTLVGLGGTW